MDTQKQPLSNTALTLYFLIRHVIKRCAKYICATVLYFSSNKNIGDTLKKWNLKILKHASLPPLFFCVNQASLKLRDPPAPGFLCTGIKGVYHHCLALLYIYLLKKTYNNLCASAVIIIRNSEFLPNLLLMQNLLLQNFELVVFIIQVLQKPRRGRGLF